MTGSTPNLDGLMRSVLAEAGWSGFLLRRLVVVASGCPPSTLAGARVLQQQDGRVLLIEEDARHGKADAVNKVITGAEGDFLVFINSDAAPEDGAVTRLLSAATLDEGVGAMSGVPITEGRRGLTPLVVDLMWNAHNEASVALNHMNLSNHSSDELVLFRASALEVLPDDIVNDGAYLAITAKRKGYTVKVCPEAGVRIQTPNRISDLVGQRRRIIFGHRQVWRRTGSTPKTVESLLILSPLLGLRLLISTLAKRPMLVLALPISAVTESMSAILSFLDEANSPRKHVIWKRFA